MLVTKTTNTEWAFDDEYCDCENHCRQCGKKKRPKYYWRYNGKTVSVSTKRLSTDDDNTVTCEVTP